MESVWTCPICGSKDIGKISRGRYFCGECCNEWTVDHNEITTYQISIDGSVVRLRSRVMDKETMASPQAKMKFPKLNVS